MSRFTLLALAPPLWLGLAGSPVLAQAATAQPPQATATVPPSAAPNAERFAADTPRATPAGATFTVPAGWSLRTRGPVVILDAPEPDSHLVLVDVHGAKDADAAVAVAWAAYRPEARRPLKLAVPKRRATGGRSSVATSTRPRRTSGRRSSPRRGGRGRSGS
jgi:hypothetical protein